MSAPAKAPPTPKAPSPATSAWTKLGASLGIVLAMVLAVLVNVFVARHFVRWDWTKGGLYTLSDPTLQTLHALEEPVTIYVLLGAGDPLTISVEQLLEAYRAETTRLDVRSTDPDRHPAEFLAIQQRYGVVPGRTEDGRIVADAAIIVARGDKTHFLTSSDLVQVEDEEDMRARPRLEQAITSALRSVLGEERPRICFTTGHGEASIDEGGASGLMALKARLAKNNYDAAEIPPTREAGRDAFAGCAVVVLAGPSERLPDEDARAVERFVTGGGSALLVVGPQPDDKEEGYLDLNVQGLLGLAGVKIQDDFLFELDPDRRSSQGFGETFIPFARPHAVTEGIVRAAKRDRGVEVVLTVGSSLEATGAGPAAPVPLLVTSEAAFGMVDFLGWAKDPRAPQPGPADHEGPLTVAFAAELERPASSAATHGSRIVVLGSTSALLGANWQSEELRGTSLFIESALSWLAARPQNLAIPNKPAFTAGLSMSADDLASVFRYVVVFMPLSAALLGLAVHLRRRGTERRGAKKAA